MTWTRKRRGSFFHSHPQTTERPTSTDSYTFTYLSNDPSTCACTHAPTTNHIHLDSSIYLLIRASIHQLSSSIWIFIHWPQNCSPLIDRWPWSLRGVYVVGWEFALKNSTSVMLVFCCLMARSVPVLIRVHSSRADFTWVASDSVECLKLKGFSWLHSLPVQALKE